MRRRAVCAMKQPFSLLPFSRSLALVGRNDSAPWEVTPSQVNALLAAWAHDWVAGPSEDVVADALGAGLGLVRRPTAH